jgi:murein DD-endopeptidase MepM/ murein hydrolase activator NlpD
MKFMNKISHSPRFFMGISWGVTALIVVSLLGFTFWRIFPVSAQPDSPLIPTTEQDGNFTLPNVDTTPGASQAIVRLLALETSFDENVRYDMVEYTVKRGDTVSSIAGAYNIKSGSLMWANDELMRNGPNSLNVGQVLLVPPVDGVLYQWEEADVLADVAEKFQATEDDILLWPGNNIDLSDPIIEAGTFVMIPGGRSDSIQWSSPVIPGSSSGTSSGSPTMCGDEGPYGGGGTLMWPSPYHYINGGNQYGSSHLAIDLFAPEGTQITAADSGVVVWASYGAWNGGYGSVVMIDHRNGFKTLYGHLSQVNVLLCQWIIAGETIGLSGNTGNSFGAHLHFEVRLGGGYLNPWDYLPPP